MQHREYLNLGELVDLETALSAGRGAEVLPVATVEKLVPTGTPNARERVALLRAWLNAAYRSDARPGIRLESGTRLLTIGLALGGLLTGAGAARYALAYEGGHPVNVVGYLGLLVLPQIVLGLMLLFNLAFRSRTLKHVGDRALGLLHAALLKALRAKTIQPESDTAGSINLSALYRPAMNWQVFFSLQVFGVAFNVAALVVSLALVTFTDLAFSWSTTLRVAAADAYRFERVLAAPFAWIDPHLVPSLEIVEKTRYFRLESRYADAAQRHPEAFRRAVDLSATMAWWPFLAACLVAYGLLPRLILTVFAWVRLKRCLYRTPLEAYEVDRLLRACLVRAGGFHRKAGSDTGSVRRHESEQAALVSPKSEGVAIIWRDAPFSDDAVRQYMRRMFGIETRLILRAGGAAGDLDSDETASRIAGLGAQGGAIYVFLDAFEALGKALVRFLEGLRSKVGAQRLILLVPVEEASGAMIEALTHHREMWQRAARQLGDPFLGVPEVQVEEARHGK
jgi:hypothetical protein